MTKSPSKESDVPSLSHIGTSVERHSSAVDSACDAHHNSPGQYLQGLAFFRQYCQSHHYQELVWIYKVHLPLSKAEWIRWSRI